MTYDEQIKASELMSIDEIERYEYAVSHRKILSIIGNLTQECNRESYDDGYNEATDKYSELIGDMELTIERLEGDIENLTNSFNESEVAKNVCNI